MRKPASLAALGLPVLRGIRPSVASKYKPVVQNFICTADKIYQLTYEDGTVIETTWSHPFYIEGKGWVKAEELRAGDVSKTDKGTLRITKVHVDPRSEEVYNFEVAENHTYLITAQGVVAHNAPEGYGESHAEFMRWMKDKNIHLIDPYADPDAMEAKRQTRDSEILGDYYDPKHGKERTALTLPTFAWRKLFDNWGEIVGSEEASQPAEIDNSISSDDGSPQELARARGQKWALSHRDTEIVMQQYVDRINDSKAYESSAYEGGLTFVPDFVKRRQQRDADEQYLGQMRALYREFKHNVRAGWRGSFFPGAEEKGFGGGGYGYQDALKRYESRRVQLEDSYIEDYNDRWGR